VALGFLALMAPGLAFTAAHIPASDDEIVERVPAAAFLKETQTLRQNFAANPDDPVAAAKLARAYLDTGRRAGDPRFISYAQAVVAPWLTRADAPTELRVLAAIALQSLHHFQSALVLLDQALAQDPTDPQALLTKATILQVNGDFVGARRTCAQLLARAGQVVTIGCVASTDAMTGKLPASYATLQQVFQDDARLPAALRSWMWGMLGEMSVRLGQDAQAEAHFRAGLAADPDDLYLIGEYADLLLRQGRSREVVTLLQSHQAQDALLLRLAIAGKALSLKESAAWADAFAARAEAANRERDTTHLREEARFMLEVRDQPVAALALAERNFLVQREPTDVRLYMQAARAAKDSRAETVISEWISTHGYEDALLPANLTAGGKATKL
jgi:Tfp pilus assembly protein PilF